MAVGRRVRIIGQQTTTALDLTVDHLAAVGHVARRAGCGGNVDALFDQRLSAFLTDGLGAGFVRGVGLECGEEGDEQGEGKFFENMGGAGTMGNAAWILILCFWP